MGKFINRQLKLKNVFFVKSLLDCGGMIIDIPLLLPSEGKEVDINSLLKNSFEKVEIEW